MAPKPRKSMLWTLENELKLIEFMKRHPFVWDCAHMNYCQVECKRLLFKEIATFLGPQFTGEMVKDRWSNMRTTFAANCRRLNSVKARDHSAETDPVPGPSWHLYNYLTFMESSVSRRASQMNNMHPVSPEHETPAIKMEEDEGDVAARGEEGTYAICRIVETTGGPGVEEDSSLHNPSMNGDFSDPEEPKPIQPPPAYENDDDVGCYSDESLPANPPPRPLRLSSTPRRHAGVFATSSSSSMAAKEEGDEWDDFGRMIAKILRKMPERDAREVEVEFFRILLSKSSRELRGSP